MGWLRDRLGRLRGGPMDVAERLTGGLLDLQQEEAELSDRGTVVRWLREMDPLTVRKFWSTGRGHDRRGRRSRRVSGGVLVRRQENVDCRCSRGSKSTVPLSSTMPSLTDASTVLG